MFSKMMGLAFVLSLAAVLPAGAFPFGLEAVGAFNTYAMDDVNNSPRWNTDIHQGLEGGVGLRVPFKQKFELNVEADYLTAGSANSSTVTANVPSLCLGAGGSLLLALFPGLNLRGTALATYTTLESAFISQGSGLQNVQLNGNTLGLQVEAGLEWAMSERWGLGLLAGYRYAKMPVVTASSDGSSATVTNPDGSNLTVDYSGLTTRVTLTYWFGQ